MFLTSSKLHLTDTPLTPQQYPQIIPNQQLQQNQPINKLDLHDFHVPLISILYAYKAGKQFIGYQLQLQLQLMLKAQKLSYKLLKYDKNTNINNNIGYIYKLIQLDSCICYQKPISAIITIKYTQNKPQQITSLIQLTTQLSSRKLIIYSQKTLSTYKRDIIIKQPLTILHRYQSVNNNNGYLWLKFINLRQYCVKIINVQLMNWLINGYQHITQYLSVNYFRQCIGFDLNQNNSMELKKQQEIGVMLSINPNLCKIQIPFVVQFQIDKFVGYRFKMIKYLYIS